MTKVVRIGTAVYAIGGSWRIYRRVPGQPWQELMDLPVPPPKELHDDTDGERTPVLWNPAGTSGHDMYPVGTAGTILHFDGDCWRKLAFPTSVDLCAVACGDHGDVFVTDRGRSLWQRTGGSWTLLCQRNEMLPYDDMAWFQDRLWCAGDGTMDVLEGDELVFAHTVTNNPVPECVRRSERIDVSPDGKKTLVCDQLSAALHDGTGWTALFDGEPAE